MLHFPGGPGSRGASVGAGSRRLLATFSYVFAGEEFEEQQGSTQFETLTFADFF